MMRIEEAERTIVFYLEDRAFLKFCDIQITIGRKLASKKTIRMALKKLVEAGRVKHWFYKDMPYYSLKGVNNAQ